MRRNWIKSSLELIVEHQAGLPLLMPPLSGNSSDVRDLGAAVRPHVKQWQTAYGLTYLGADSALYSDANLAQLAQTQSKWITRVPATVSDAQAALAQAAPQRMASLKDGYRSEELNSTYGGVEQRWLLLFSAHRQPHAQRSVDKQLRKHSDQESKAFKKLCSTTFAGPADARQALATFEQSLQATFLSTGTVSAKAGYSKRGRPRKGDQPDQVVYQIAGALASSLAARKTRLAQHRCCILATNELDPARLPPSELWQGYKGQGQSERGCRFLKAPQFFASSLYLKKPERIMALLMVMTVCLLVYAALEYRIRKALKDQGATFPDQKGKPIQNPTARWVFHCFVGSHLLLMPGQWPLVRNLTEEHQQLLRLLGKPYMWFYGVKYS